jgi:SAM-dependent methyltransferase
VPEIADVADRDDKSRIEATVATCYSTWSEGYAETYYGKDAPYPPVHLTLTRNILTQAAPRSLLDAGCGPASMLRRLTDLGIELYGFDLTPEMVATARRVMGETGLPEDRLWQGSVTDPVAYRPPHDGDTLFDAAICVGVLPHIPAEFDGIVLANLRNAVRPGAVLILEARNQLFALFTLNRYSRDFVFQELIRTDELPKGPALDEALTEIEQRFRLDLPPQRRGTAATPGYDEILSRTHNPLVLRQMVEAAGFHDVRVLFYHYHRLPPMAQSKVPELFLAESIAMENAEDWRGHFMASAFLVTGTRT